MKKVLISLLCLILVVSLLPIGITSNAASDSFTISITADNTVYHRGDNITYTVKIKQTGTLTAFGFNLDVPSSLTYVSNSPNGSASSTLGFTGQGEGAGISVNTVGGTQYYTFTGFGANAFTGSEEVTLGTITFKVNNDAAYGSVSVGVLNDDDLAANNEDYGDKAITINKSTVNVEQIKVPSTGVTVAPTSSSIAAGSTVQLTATLEPSESTDEVTWTTSDSNVATVDTNGLVTGQAIGTATITATTTSGKTATSSISVTCNHANTTKHEAVASTCVVQGNEEYYTCDACGEVVRGSDAKLPLADHNYGTWVEEVSPVHENKTSLPGTKGHYQCSVCNKYFDANHNEITDLTIPAEAHTAQGNYKLDENNHWKECACGIIMDSEAHTPAEAVEENKVDPTCTKAGSHDEVVYCSVCHYEMSRQTITDDALGHTQGEMVKENITAPTCEEAGKHDEVYYCTVCNEEISRTTVTDNALGHTPAEAVRENEVPATHAQEGSYDEVVYCSVCNKEISRTNKTIDIIPHSAQDDTWDNDENEHWQICGCGVKINIAEHTEAEAVKENIVAATCEEAGSHDDVVYCSVCHRELSRTKVTDDALGHKEGEMVKENIVAATCEKAGSHDEVVYCSVCNKELSREKVTDEALGHTGGSADCIHKAICTRCNEEYGDVNPNVHTGNTEVKDAKEATVNEEGYTGDTYCKDCGALLEKGKVTDKFVYKMLEGMNGVHVDETSNTLTFKSNGKLEKLTSVEVDEKEITLDKDYTKASGSTIITLASDYLNSLALGTHTLQMNYDDGEVSTEFSIQEKPVEETSNKANNSNTKTKTPKTGDESQMALWIMGVVLSIGCLVGVSKWNTSKKAQKSPKHLK